MAAKGENHQVARKERRSAGVAVFVGRVADQAHGVGAEWCHERLVLQATALGLCMDA